MRYGTAGDAAVNQYLDTLAGNSMRQVGDIDSGGYKRVYGPSPYFKPWEDPNDPAVRRRIAAALGVTNFDAPVQYPDETNSPIDAAAMTAVMAFGGGVAGAAAAGAGSAAGSSGSLGDLAATDLGGGYSSVGPVGGGADASWGANLKAGGGMDWIDQLIQESGSWAEGTAPSSFTSTTANPNTWAPNAVGDPNSALPWMDNSPTFQNADGTWGSTAANSGPGGSGAYPGYTGNDLSFLPNAPGLVDYAKKYGLDALKALGLGESAINAIARAVPGIAGAISSADQAGRLSDLSAQQRGDEATRYADQVRREQERYTTEAARQDAARQQNIALEAARYADETGRQDAAIGRQASDIAGDKAVVAPSQARYEASFQPGFTMSNDPGYTDALNAAGKATLHSLSVGGNPAGSPNAWAATEKDLYDKTAYPALKAYRDTNAATGFTGPYASGASTVRAIPSTITGSVNQGIPPTLGDPFAGNTLSTPAGGTAALSSITQGGQTAANLGGAVSDVFNPKSTLDDLVKKLKGAGNIFAVQ